MLHCNQHYLYNMRQLQILPLLFFLIVTCTSKTDRVNTPHQETLDDGMKWIPGGEFVMGTNDPESYETERPAHPVRVKGFWMDETEVTNAQFSKFVEDTKYVTVAERKPVWEELR